MIEDIQVNIDFTGLHITDNYSKTLLCDGDKYYLAVELITNENNNIITYNGAELINTINNTIKTNYYIDNDGVHYYYKIFVPSIQSLFINDGSSTTGWHCYGIFCDKVDDTYNYYVYTGAQHDFKSDEPLDKEGIEIQKSIILNNSKQILNTELHLYLNDHNLYYKEGFFCTNNITQCFIKQYYDKTEKSNKCNTALNNNDYLLFVGLHVINYLLDINNYGEAKNLLEILTSNNCECIKNNCGCYE